MHACLGKFVDAFNKNQQNQEIVADSLLSGLKNRARNVCDFVDQNLILIFAGGIVSVIAALTLTWIALQTKHDQISQLLVRSF